MDVDISISLELLILLEWIVKNEKNVIDNIVKNALKNGLIQQLNQLPDKPDMDMIEKFYPTVINFLLAMENSLIESLVKEQDNVLTNQEILPLLKKINLADINIKTIYQSTSQANKKIKSHKYDNLNSQQILFQQLLKNWKPGKKDQAN
ncbi:MAG: hypothetical protein US49_C0002G0103 [candidate division TM6 bacterium GW2011_GWF2_37_49]|nr:MAG: hypothetical protein US49_C0002G0103 [candidate division TM6 bacterium GW2011_GWF2_37_49]